MDSVKHLEKYINEIYDSIDCSQKISTFIRYVNKLACNYNHLQPNTLIDLSYTKYCDSYCSDLGKFNAKGFEICCIT